MQPKLKSRNAMSLEFSTTIPLSDEQILKIRKTSEPDEDGDSVFLDSYEGHRAAAIVKSAQKDTPKYEIDFVYQAKSGGRLSKNLARIKQLADIISSVKEQLNFECVIAFTFGRSFHPKPIISLPMKYIEAPNMPFDRIQGLHLVKLEGNKTKYEIFLEAPTRGILFENVQFNYLSSFDESLPEKILTEAESISSNIVFRGSKDAQVTK